MTMGCEEIIERVFPKQIVGKTSFSKEEVN